MQLKIYFLNEVFCGYFAYAETVFICFAVVAKKASDDTNYAEIFFLISS